MCTREIDVIIFWGMSFSDRDLENVKYVCMSCVSCVCVYVCMFICIYEQKVDKTASKGMFKEFRF